MLGLGSLDLRPAFFFLFFVYVIIHMHGTAATYTVHDSVYVVTSLLLYF